MREHIDEPTTDVEGVGDTGWVEAPQQWAQPLITVTLCRYTGLPYDVNGRCLERENHQHPNEPCWENFLSASSLVNGYLPEMLDTAIEVRLGVDGLTGTER